MGIKILAVGLILLGISILGIVMPQFIVGILITIGGIGVLFGF